MSRDGTMKRGNVPSRTREKGRPRKALDLGDGHVHHPRREFPHLATEVAANHPHIAAELTRNLRTPFRNCVVPPSVSMDGYRPDKKAKRRPGFSAGLKEAVRNAEAA